jgi:hypothetical protein
MPVPVPERSAQFRVLPQNEFLPVFYSQEIRTDITGGHLSISHFRK